MLVTGTSPDLIQFFQPHTHSQVSASIPAQVLDSAGIELVVGSNHISLLWIRSTNAPISLKFIRFASLFSATDLSGMVSGAGKLSCQGGQQVPLPLRVMLLCLAGCFPWDCCFLFRTAEWSSPPCVFWSHRNQREKILSSTEFLWLNDFTSFSSAFSF